METEEDLPEPFSAAANETVAQTEDEVMDGQELVSMGPEHLGSGREVLMVDQFFCHCWAIAIAHLWALLPQLQIMEVFQFLLKL